jgi:hypothetical protein
MCARVSDNQAAVEDSAIVGGFVVEHAIAAIEEIIPNTTQRRRIPARVVEKRFIAPTPVCEPEAGAGRSPPAGPSGYPAPGR